MAGKYRINGQTKTQKQDGTWLGPEGNKMSNESHPEKYKYRYTI